MQASVLISCFQTTMLTVSLQSCHILMFGITWVMTRKQAGHTSKAAILQVDASRSESKERVFMGKLRFCAKSDEDFYERKHVCVMPT